MRGLGDACRALSIPVVGGNVSLYNEGAEGPIYPTPVVGLVGELPDVHRAGRIGFRAEGDRIAIVGVFAPEIRGSELARLGGTELPNALPECDIERVRETHQAVRDCTIQSYCSKSGWRSAMFGERSSASNASPASSETSTRSGDG